MIREAGEIAWLEPSNRLGEVARVAMTTRLGGVSRPPYDRLNLAFHVGDVEERVRQNRRALRRALGGGLREPVVGHQVHGTLARPVGELHAGANWEQREKALAGTDALVTATPRLPLVTLVADCLPIALVDPVRRACAVVHAGWRGLADGVIEQTLGCLSSTWGSMASDVVAWMGPAIGPCCYPVGAEVAARFPGATEPVEAGRARLDLRRAASARLSAAGLLEENVTGLPLCTSCRADLFFSHRRATGAGDAATGRQALILWLEPAATSS